MNQRRATAVARLIVGEIIADITDRRGLRQAWDSIDEDIQREIRAAWRKIIEASIVDPNAS